MIKKINDYYAPFCHGTGNEASHFIDKFGINPRGKSKSVWDTLQSSNDKVYLASVKEYAGMCAMAMESACRKEGLIPWVNCGIFYILDEVPDEMEKDLDIDEDCLQYDEWCRDALESLETVKTFSVKGSIPRHLLKKMNPKEFFFFARKHDDQFDEGKNWKEWKSWAKSVFG